MVKINKVRLENHVPEWFDSRNYRVLVSFRFNDKGQLRRIIRRLEEK